MSTDWDQIEVRVLCEMANVGRSTFYQHFEGKEGLLQSSLDSLRDELLAAAKAGPRPEQPLAFLPMLLAHVHHARAILRNTLGRRSGHLVQSRFRDMLVDLFSAGVQKASDPLADSRPHLMAGALYGLLIWWLNSDRPHSPADVEALFLDFAGRSDEGPGRRESLRPSAAP